MTHSQIVAKYQNEVVSLADVNIGDRMDLDDDINMNTGNESKVSLFDNTNFSDTQEKPSSLLNESNSEDQRKYFQNMSVKWNVNKRNNKNHGHNKYEAFEYPDD